MLERAGFGQAATQVAAGMIAPVAEANAGERALLALCMESARRWPAFAAELADVTGIDVNYRPTGTLMVARDRDGAEALEREFELRERFGLEVTRLLPSAAREMESALAPTIRLALDVPHDHAVDPRLVTAALAHAAEQVGVNLRSGVEVVSVRPGAGVVLADGELVAAGHVVIAAGAWSSAFDGIPDDARVPIRPVKGQSLRLRDPHHAARPLLERVVRFGHGYLVPRGDGRYALGGTVEERGFDTTVSAGGVYELLRNAAEVVPGVLELEVEEAIAGLRPGTPDNAPILGRSGTEGLVWATGHYRHGILLAPVTADLVAADIAGEPADHAFGPERFLAAGSVT